MIKEEGEIQVSKGKEKVLVCYTFNNDGQLSQEAIEILDSGSLIPLSNVFKGPVINLKAEVFQGIYAKDVLESAVTGTLDQLVKRMVHSRHQSGILKISGIPESKSLLPLSKISFLLYHLTWKGYSWKWQCMKKMRWLRRLPREGSSRLSILVIIIYKVFGFSLGSSLQFDVTFFSKGSSNFPLWCADILETLKSNKSCCLTKK